MGVQTFPTKRKRVLEVGPNREVPAPRAGATDAADEPAANTEVRTARCIFTSDAMPWLADTDVGAAHGFARAIVEVRMEAELRRRAVQALADLVPSDVLTWDRVELATGAVHHEVVPAGAEPPGAFEAIVGNATDHPLLSAHSAGRRSPLRLSEAVEPRRLSHSELYGDLLQRSGVEYEIAIGMRTGRGEAVVIRLGRTECEFSERDRDVLALMGPALEDALRATDARGRHAPALAANTPPGTALVLLDSFGEIEL